MPPPSRYSIDAHRPRRARAAGELKLDKAASSPAERFPQTTCDRVRLLAKIVDGVLEAVAVLPYYRLAPPARRGRSPAQLLVL